MVYTSIHCSFVIIMYAPLLFQAASRSLAKTKTFLKSQLNQNQAVYWYFHLCICITVSEIQIQAAFLAGHDADASLNVG